MAGRRYADELDISQLTPVNLSVLKQYTGGSPDTIIEKVETTSIEHMKRAIRAGALEPAGARKGLWRLSARGLLALQAAGLAGFGDFGAGCEPKSKEFTTKAGKRVSFMARPSPKCDMSDALKRVRENLAAASARCKREMPGAGVVERAKTCIGPALSRKALPAPMPEPEAPAPVRAEPAELPMKKARALNPEAFLKKAMGKKDEGTNYGGKVFNIADIAHPASYKLPVAVSTDGQRMHLVWGFQSQVGKAGDDFERSIKPLVQEVMVEFPHVGDASEKARQSRPHIIELGAEQIERIISMTDLEFTPNHPEAKVNEPWFDFWVDGDIGVVSIKATESWKEMKPGRRGKMVSTTETELNEPTTGKDSVLRTMDLNRSNIVTLNQGRSFGGGYTASFSAKYIRDALVGKTRVRMHMSYGEFTSKTYVEDLTPRIFRQDAILAGRRRPR